MEESGRSLYRGTVHNRYLKVINKVTDKLSKFSRFLYRVPKLRLATSHRNYYLSLDSNVITVSLL